MHCCWYAGNDSVDPAVTAAGGYFSFGSGHIAQWTFRYNALLGDLRQYYPTYHICNGTHHGSFYGAHDPNHSTHRAAHHGTNGTAYHSANNAAYHAAAEAGPDPAVYL